ncbi:hypothetical protein BC629DRAFT_1446209 [Irpex lacteus]|nr:hypothetical protein BC629DRAFT_1446209 [Irpex lacteus]
MYLCIYYLPFPVSPSILIYTKPTSEYYSNYTVNDYLFEQPWGRQLDGNGLREDTASLARKNMDLNTTINNELGLVEAHVVQGDVLLLVLLVVHDGVALGEGIALDVLPGDTNVDLLESERTKGESLSGGPVNVLAPFDGFATWAEDKSRDDMILESVMLTAERVRWNTTYMALNSSYPARSTTRGRHMGQTHQGVSCGVDIIDEHRPKVGWS